MRLWCRGLLPYTTVAIWFCFCRAKRVHGLIDVFVAIVGNLAFGHSNAIFIDDRLDTCSFGSNKNKLMLWIFVPCWATRTHARGKIIEWRVIYEMCTQYTRPLHTTFNCLQIFILIRLSLQCANVSLFLAAVNDCISIVCCFFFFFFCWIHSPREIIEFMRIRFLLLLLLFGPCTERIV